MVLDEVLIPVGGVLIVVGKVLKTKIVMFLLLSIHRSSSSINKSKQGINKSIVKTVGEVLLVIGGVIILEDKVVVVLIVR